MQIPSKDTAPIGVAIMTAPTSPTPDQDRPDPVRQPSLISREVLEGYLNCKYKGHLKLKGEQGTKSDYEAMIGTDQGFGVSLEHEDGDTRGGRGRCWEMSAYTSAARHAAKCAESGRTRNVA